jgi:probable rRNA maturation factor
VTRAIYIGPWRIDLTVRKGILAPVSGAALGHAIAAALTAAGAISPASIGLILSDDAELAELNETHLGKAGPTDVLSFPLLPPAAFPEHAGRTDRGAGMTLPFALPPGRRPHVGDIVVSVERAIEQAEAGRGGQTGDILWSPTDELRLLVTHGTLHLCGWDHAEPAEQAAMRGLESALIGSPLTSRTTATPRPTSGRRTHPRPPARDGACPRQRS